MTVTIALASTEPSESYGRSEERNGLRCNYHVVFKKEEPVPKVSHEIRVSLVASGT